MKLRKTILAIALFSLVSVNNSSFADTKKVGLVLSTSPTLINSSSSLKDKLDENNKLKNNLLNDNLFDTLVMQSKYANQSVNLSTLKQSVPTNVNLIDKTQENIRKNDELIKKELLKELKPVVNQFTSLKNEYNQGNTLDGNDINLFNNLLDKNQTAIVNKVTNTVSKSSFNDFSYTETTGFNKQRISQLYESVKTKEDSVNKAVNSIFSNIEKDLDNADQFFASVESALNKGEKIESFVDYAITVAKFLAKSVKGAITAIVTGDIAKGVPIIDVGKYASNTLEYLLRDSFQKAAEDYQKRSKEIEKEKTKLDKEIEDKFKIKTDLYSPLVNSKSLTSFAQSKNLIFTFSDLLMGVSNTNQVLDVKIGGVYIVRKFYISCQQLMRTKEQVKVCTLAALRNTLDELIDLEWKIYSNGISDTLHKLSTYKSKDISESQQVKQTIEYLNNAYETSLSNYKREKQQIQKISSFLNKYRSL